MSPHVKSYRNEVSRITFRLFKLFVKYGKNTQANNLFSTINKMFDNNVFINTKAYCVYYSYQTKNYSEIGDLLSYNSVEVLSSRYHDHVDFCMFQFFRGLIALSERVNLTCFNSQNFFNASINFLCALKVKFGGNLYNTFQLESIRRLILLSNIVDSVLKKAINETISNFKILLFVKPISIYEDFNKLLNNVYIICLI